MIALGRYWNATVLPILPWWNLCSALLEVAICVMAYVCVLWVEVLPPSSTAPPPAARRAGPPSASGGAASSGG